MSDDVKRYRFDVTSEGDRLLVQQRCNDGGFVEYTDYAALQQQLDLARQDLDKISYICECAGIPSQRLIGHSGEADIDDVPLVDRVQELKQQLEHYKKLAAGNDE